MLAGAMLQSVLLAGNTGGIALAVDIEMGFTDRLLAAPISRFAIVARPARRNGGARRVTRVWFIAIGLIFGASIERGRARDAPDDARSRALAAVAFGGLGAAIALHTGEASVVQGLFPLVFVILFLSTAFFPANLLLEPAASIAEYNPLSFIVEGIRDPVIGSLSVASRAEGVRRDRARRRDLDRWLSRASPLRRRLRVG